jgi:hypothetical protein
MARRKGSSISTHFWISAVALEVLRTETERLGTRPGKFLSRLILERSETFLSRPVQLNVPDSLQPSVHC